MNVFSGNVESGHLSVRLSVSLSHGVMQLCCANTAEQINVLLGVETFGNSKNTGSFDSPCGFDVALAKLLWPFVPVVILLHMLLIF